MAGMVGGEDASDKAVQKGVEEIFGFERGVSGCCWGEEFFEVGE